MDACHIDWSVLRDDAKENFEALGSDDSQRNRRNYIRSLFALFEGTLADLRETAARALINEFQFAGEWRVHKLEPLMDGQARLGHNGKLKVDTNRTSFAPTLAYALRIVAETRRIEPTFLSGAGWDAMQRATKVRHRITHPKRGESVEINDEDLLFAEAARRWLNETLGTIFSRPQEYNSDQSGLDNLRPFGASGMSPADSAPWAGETPETNRGI